MITVLRSYFKRGSQVILWIIVLTFIIGLMPLALRQVTGSSVWAIRVNGQDIAYQEYLLEQERMRERLSMLRAQLGEYADMILAQLGLESLQMEGIKQLVRQELLNQFADEVSLNVSPEFMTEKMSDPVYVLQTLGDIVPRHIVDPTRGINQAMLQRYLKHFNLSVDLFDRIVEKALTERFVADLLKSSFYVPRFDVRQQYVAQHAPKKFSVHALPLKKLLEQEKKQAVTQEELKKFYDQHRQRYAVPEKRSGMMWKFDSASYGISVRDAQIESYYEDNKLKQFIADPAKVTVRRILFKADDDAALPGALARAEKIKAELSQDPSLFAQVAQRASEDETTAENGGLMEPFARGTHEVPLDRAAFLLQADGDISDVIRTAQGYQILQRVSKIPQTFKPLAAVKAEIKKQLMEKAFASQFTHDMNEVIDRGESLDALIKKRGGTTQKLDRIAQDATPLAEHIFKVKPGETTFFMDGNTGVALRLDTIQERFTPTLDAITQMVENDLYEQRAQDTLATQLNELKLAMKSGASLQQFDAETWETGWVKPDDQKELETLKDKGLPTEKMLQMEKEGALLAHRGDEQGWVIRLEQLTPIKPEEIDVQLATQGSQFYEQRIGQYFQGFVDSLQRNAKIETNESIITFQD